MTELSVKTTQKCILGTRFKPCLWNGKKSKLGEIMKYHNYEIRSQNYGIIIMISQKYEINKSKF